MVRGILGWGYWYGGYWHEVSGTGDTGMRLLVRGLLG